MYQTDFIVSLTAILHNQLMEAHQTIQYLGGHFY